MWSRDQTKISPKKIYIFCIAQSLSNEDGRFYGEENPPKKDSKGEGLVGRRVPDRLKEGKESLRRWTSVREGKGRTRQNWTHGTSKPIFVFLVFLLRAVRRR